jgi:DNA uptake protein ComE-like DNA-binding protein
VHELVAAAGGAPADADLTRASLAGALADGGRVHVACARSDSSTRGGKLRMNAASDQDFRFTLGVGSDIAQRIIACGAAYGPFAAISRSLLAPSSQSTFARICPLVTV